MGPVEDKAAAAQEADERASPQVAPQRETEVTTHQHPVVAPTGEVVVELQEALPIASDEEAYHAFPPRGGPASAHAKRWRTVGPADAQRLLDIQRMDLFSLARKGRLAVLAEADKARVSSRSLLRYIQAEGGREGSLPALRLADCAQLLEMDRWTLEDRVQSRALAYVPVDGQRLVPADELLRALQELEPDEDPLVGKYLNQVVAGWGLQPSERWNLCGRVLVIGVRVTQRGMVRSCPTPSWVVSLRRSCWP